MRKRSFEQLGETLFEDTLPNGLRLCVVPKKGFRSFYALLAVNYGGAHRRFRYEGERFDLPAGTAHYLEHKMFDLPGGDDAMRKLTANGADPNASTGADMTAYYFECTENFEENLRLLLHFVSTPYFTEETVEKERGIITQEILMGEDDPDLALYMRLLQMLYAAHPLRERVAGTVESIQGITPETLSACHRAFYAPSNLALCVEGDVDPERVRTIAAELLPGEAAPLPEVDFGPEEGLLPVESLVRCEADVSAPQFLISAKLRAEKQGEAALRQRLTAVLAVQTLLGRSSPFFTELYTQGLINLDFFCEADFLAGEGMILLGGESRSPEQVRSALLRTLEELKKRGLDEQRFERTKRASLGARLRGLEDFETVCFALASGVFEGYCAFEGQLLLNEISRADCERFLLDALQPERLALAIFEPKGK